LLVILKRQRYVHLAPVGALNNYLAKLMSGKFYSTLREPAIACCAPPPA
jgi:hypothetical protein